MELNRINNRLLIRPGGFNLLGEIISNLKKIAKISVIIESGNSEGTEVKL